MKNENVPWNKAEETAGKIHPIVPGVEQAVAPAVDPEVAPAVDPEMEPAVDPAVDPGPEPDSGPAEASADVVLVDKEELKGRLEAVLFAGGDPISVREMAQLLEVVPDTIEVLLDEMAGQYQKSSRGIMILRLGDRLQLATKAEYSRWVLKLAQVNERQTLSKGALECLAIVAYKQPVTRVEVDEIRGVSSDYVMNKLLERGFITVIGRKNVPGRPKLYATTEEFLRQFGFSNLKVFTGDETYQELMRQVERGQTGEDELILPVTEEDEELESQITIWDQGERP